MKEIGALILAFFLCGVFAVGAVVAFEQILPDSSTENNMRSDRNFKRIFYKRFSVPPSTTNYEYGDSVEVSNTTVITATSNTSGNVVAAVLTGEMTLEVVLGGSYATTTEVSVIGVSQDEILN